MRELYVLQLLRSQNFENQLIAHGKTDCGHCYIILNKYGPNLKVVLEKSKFDRFTTKTVI